MRAVPAFLVLLLSVFAGAQSTQPASRPTNIVGRFVEGGSREVFLADLKAALAFGKMEWHEAEFESMITALEREPAPPPGYDKAVDRRTQDEAIAAAIYDLRDYGGWSRGEGKSTKTVIDFGPAAMDALVAALDDDTPSRAVGYEVGPSTTILLRRSDLALRCIERISGLTFFRRTQGRGGQFHNDAERASVTQNVRNWWKEARGQSQAEGVRVQLKLWKDNTTLYNRQMIQYGYFKSIEAGMYYELARLETPELVIDRLREIKREEKPELNSYATDELMKLDPQFVLRGAMMQLKSGPEGRDLVLLLEYGDKAVYEELTRLSDAGQLNTGGWSRGDFAQRAATFGKGWAIPLIAAVLSDTKMTGSGVRFGAPPQNFCAADDAIMELAKLTGKDFGYKWSTPEADRLAAFARARQWWTTTGRKEMAEKIAADHPSKTDGTDLLWTEEQIAAAVDALNGDDAAARAAVAKLNAVYAFRTRTALVGRLTKEPDATQRLAILQKLTVPALWLLPDLAAVYEKDPSIEVRVAAGNVLQAWMASTGNERRLDPRDRAMDAVRRVAVNTPAELAPVTLSMLQKFGVASDAAVIKTLTKRAAE